jgi:chromosome segregation ATPase
MHGRWHLSTAPPPFCATSQAKASLVEQEKELQKVVQQNASVMADMINLKNPWKTALDNAVKNLSTKFEKYMKDMGCSGEVKLNCADTGMAEEVMKPFKDWGLEIRVAFRDIREEARREALSVLSANQHSGGECSVSTILFLMALQSFNTSTPFCVVDEINQGMDEVNERLAFSRIVLNSCSRECDSQYFLITPKLLQGLTAMENEDVTVLFVFNGPWVPRGGGANFLLKEFAKKKKKKEVEDGADGRGTKRARIR